MGTKANSVQVAPSGEQYLQLHAPAFRRRLLRWFGRNGRDLPWRRTRDPYHIMVSEFMLQQTQVVRVEGFYHRFLARYPTLEDLASAPPAMVRESWEGLGYYRRAVNLHRLATGSDPEQRRRHSLGDRGAAPTAGDRSVHRRGSRKLCFRARGHPDRYQCVPGASPGVPFPSEIEGFGSTPRTVGGNATAQRRQESLDVQPGNYGAGSVGLYRTGAPLWDLSGAGNVSDGCPGNREDYFSIAPAKSATRPKVPAIEATIRWRARSSSK